MAVTRRELIKYLAEMHHISQTKAGKIVEIFFDELLQQIYQGKNIHFSGFGNFLLRSKNARIGRNPKTKEEYEISARKVLTFKTSKKLKADIDYEYME